MKKLLVSACIFAIMFHAVAGMLSENDRLNRVDKRKNGDVIIQRIPAIEQKRNFCLPASIEMILRYFGARINQKELGKIFQSSRKNGTSRDVENKFGRGELQDFTCIRLHTLNSDEYSRMINAYLNSPALTGTAKKKFKKRLESENAFNLIDLHRGRADIIPARQATAVALQKACKKYIDLGYPLLWSVAMNFDPNDRDDGFHARIIAGYKQEKGIITEIIYLDSWYGRRKFKRMSFTDAVLQTTAFSVIMPK